MSSRPSRWRFVVPVGPLRIAAIACALSMTAGCRTRPYDLTDDAEFESTNDGPLPDAFDAAKPLDLFVPRDNCGVVVIQTTQIIRADLLLIQDKSRSMNDGVDGRRNPPAGQSKWAVVRAAIEQVVGSTTAVDWGLMLFGNDNACGAPLTPDVPVGPGTAARIRSVLDSTTPNSSTPTTQTIKNALAWFVRQNDQHPHFMLLATDGQPTCNRNQPMSTDSAAAIQAVADAAAAGVSTFIVGVGANTMADQTLAAMARAGGVPNTTPGQPAYYAVNSTQDLVSILEKAALRITPCSYPVSSMPPDPSRVVIQSSVGQIPRDPAHQDGWDFSDDGQSFVFYGPACEQLRSGVVTSVDAIYGCPGDL